MYYLFFFLFLQIKAINAENMLDMDALSNVEARRGEATPPSLRFIPETIPEAQNSKAGVSVKNVPGRTRVGSFFWPHKMGRTIHLNI